jgi:hypothetical protein
MIKTIATVVSAATCCGLIIILVSPLSMAEKAFAIARAESADVSAVNQPPHLSCKDLEFWLLNPICSQVRAKHTARTKHRVVTYAPARSAGARIATAKR